MADKVMLEVVINEEGSLKIGWRSLPKHELLGILLATAAHSALRHYKASGTLIENDESVYNALISQDFTNALKEVGKYEIAPEPKPPGESLRLKFDKDASFDDLAIPLDLYFDRDHPKNYPASELNIKKALVFPELCWIEDGDTVVIPDFDKLCEAYFKK